MIIKKNERREIFSADDGESITIEYDNRGEPYRDGICFYIDGTNLYSFLEEREVKRLRDLLNRLFPISKP